MQKLQPNARSSYKRLFCESVKTRTYSRKKTYRDGDFKTIFVSCSCQGRLQAEQNKVKRFWE